MDSESASSQSSFDETSDFLIAVAVAARRFGITSEQAGAFLGRFARALGVKAEFGVDPQRLDAVFTQPGTHRQRVHLIGVRPAGLNMSKLAQLTDILGSLEARTSTPAEAMSRFHDLDIEPPVYGKLWTALAFVLSSVAFAATLRLSWTGLALAGALSQVSFVFSRKIRKQPEFASALVVSLLATLTAKVVPEVNASAVAICAVIWFVPGFGLALAIRELVSGATVIGLDLMSGAILTAMKLMVGNALGAAIADLILPGRSLRFHAGVPASWVWAFVPLLALGLAVISQVRRKELGWMVPASLLVWTVQRGGNVLGPWEGAFLAAVSLRLFGAFFGARTGLPASIILLPNVLLLVPGLGLLQIVQDLPEKGLVAGLNAGMQVLLVCAAIVVGVAMGEGISVGIEKRWRSIKRWRRVH